jgi:hypothetical protein
MDKVYLHKIKDGVCNQCLVKKKYACYAGIKLKLKVGDCKSAGYPISDGYQEIKVPIIGTITIDKFKQE